jgi:hypothetical protein
VSDTVFKYCKSEVVRLNCILRLLKEMLIYFEPKPVFEVLILGVKDQWRKMAESCIHFSKQVFQAQPLAGHQKTN